MKPELLPRKRFVQWSLLSGIACVLYVLGHDISANFIMTFSGFFLQTNEEIARPLKWREDVRILAGSALLLAFLIYGSFHWWNGSAAGGHDAESWVNRLWYVALWVLLLGMMWRLSRAVPADGNDESQGNQEVTHNL